MQAMYDALDQGELRAVAGICSLTIEDVRQEARLLCWTIASGQSDYDPDQGSIRQYVMGRLWGMALRWQCPVALGDNGTDGGGRMEAGDGVRDHALLERSPYHRNPEDPLEVLLAVEEDKACRTTSEERRQRLLAMLDQGERTFLEMLMVLPNEQIARMYDLTERAVRYRRSRLAEKLFRLADSAGLCDAGVRRLAREALVEKGLQWAG